MPMDGASNSMIALPKAIHFSCLRLELFSSVAWSNGAQLMNLFCFRFLAVLFGRTRDLHLLCNTLHLLSPRICPFIVLKRDVFVYRNDSLTS